MIALLIILGIVVVLIFRSACTTTWSNCGIASRTHGPRSTSNWARRWDHPEPGRDGEGLQPRGPRAVISHYSDPLALKNGRGEKC